MCFILGFYSTCDTIQINHQPDATVFQLIILTFIYSSTCFGLFPAHHQELNDCSGSLWFYLRIVVTVVLCSWSGPPARPRPTALLPPRSYGKPEAAAAVDRLLMMGKMMPETCWAVFNVSPCMLPHLLYNPTHTLFALENTITSTFKTNKMLKTCL